VASVRGMPEARRAVFRFLPFLFLPMGMEGGRADLSAQSWSDFTSSRRITSEQEFTARVRYGAGRLNVNPAPAGGLYALRIRYDEELFRPTVSYRSGALEVGMEGGQGRRVQLRRGESEAELDLQLPVGIPVDLHMELGAVRSRMELGGILVRTLEMATGASETVLEVSRANPGVADRVKLEVGAASFQAKGLGNLNARVTEVTSGVGDVRLDFTGSWREDGSVRVKLGLGALELTFPRDVGVQVTRSGLLAPVTAPEFSREPGNVFRSPSWEGASRRVTVEVEAALGSVEIRLAP